MKKYLILLIGILLSTGTIIAIGNTGMGTVTVGGGEAPSGGTAGAAVLGFDWIPLQQNVEDPHIIINPVSELVDLEQVGTLGSPYIVNLTQSFDYITSITWTLQWTMTTLDIINKFGIASPLTNGINVFYDGNSLLDNNNITTIEDFSNQEYSAYKFAILSDEVQQREMLAKWLYLEDGLRIFDTKQYQIYIQDDLSALQNVTEFSATIEGYQRIVDSYFDVNDIYYPDDINNIVLRYLVPGRNYNLKINSSVVTDGEMWINETSEEDNILIQLYFEISSDANIVSLYLHEENVLLEQKDMFVEGGSLGFLNLYIPIIGFIGLCALGLFIFMLFTGSGPKFRGR